MDEFHVSEFGEKIYSLSKESLYESKSKSSPSIYVTVLSTFIVRSGIFLAQVSSIPSSNMQVLILQNFLDISMNTIAFCLLGYMFAFGDDLYHFVGVGTFLSENSNMNDFAIGWMIIIIASGLLTSAVGDRISLIASLTLNFLISGITFPVIIHWVLSESGWMKSNTLDDIKVSYKDYNYSAVIHMSGGFISFLGLIVLNRRLLLFRDIDASSIPDNGPSLTMFGYLMMILGFIGLSMPGEKYETAYNASDFNGIILINVVLSLFGSILSTLILSFLRPFEPIHKWTGLRFIQSGVSGIAVIAGGADVYYPLVSIAIGFINGFIFSVVTTAIDKSSMEDYCKITAVHFASGSIGTLLPRMLNFREGYKNEFYKNFLLFAWQLLCDCVILAFLAIIFVPVLLALDKVGILRTFDEYVNHSRAKTIRKSVSKIFETKPDGYLEPGYRRRLQPERGGSKMDLFFERTDRFFEADLPKDKNFVVNYIINSAPKIFFEELEPEVERKRSSFFKGFGDVIANTLPKLDIKKINSLKNISDTKLFQRFKEAIPKKMGVWKRGSTIPFRSASIPSFSDCHLNAETQV